MARDTPHDDLGRHAVWSCRVHRTTQITVAGAVAVAVAGAMEHPVQLKHCGIDIDIVTLKLDCLTL